MVPTFLSIPFDVQFTWNYNATPFGECQINRKVLISHDSTPHFHTSLSHLTSAPPSDPAVK